MPTIHTNDVCWFPFALCTVGLGGKDIVGAHFHTENSVFFLKCMQHDA